MGKDKRYMCFCFSKIILSLIGIPSFWFWFWRIVAINTIVWWISNGFLILDRSFVDFAWVFLIVKVIVTQDTHSDSWILARLGLSWFVSFFKDAKLGIKLLCLSKRPPKYQKVEINIKIYFHKFYTLVIN
jgi:hypothetical protein